MAEAARWYVVHTYSGYENTVKATIEKTVQSRQLQDQILSVVIPMETVTEITESGTSKTYDRKLYPGYVFIKMVYSDDTWHVIRNIRGVTGFVGPGSRPVPLTEAEVAALGVDTEVRVREMQYAVGDSVIVVAGFLAGSIATVREIDEENGRIKVTALIAGKETNIEMNASEVEPLKN